MARLEPPVGELRVPAIIPTILQRVVSVTGPATLTVVPLALRSITLLNVTVARRKCGALARIPGGDSWMVTQTSRADVRIVAREERSKCGAGRLLAEMRHWCADKLTAAYDPFTGRYKSDRRGRAPDRSTAREPALLRMCSRSVAPIDGSWATGPHP